jgi:hypothetical protein
VTNANLVLLKALRRSEGFYHNIHFLILLMLRFLYLTRYLQMQSFTKSMKRIKTSSDRMWGRVINAYIFCCTSHSPVWLQFRVWFATDFSLLFCPSPLLPFPLAACVSSWIGLLAIWPSYYYRLLLHCCTYTYVRRYIALPASRKLAGNWLSWS